MWTHLSAACSLGKWPRALTARRILAWLADHAATHTADPLADRQARAPWGSARIRWLRAVEAHLSPGAGA
jgi:hypothetical protein